MMDKTTTATATASYVTSGAITTGGWFSSHDWPFYLGLILAIGTFLLNGYFKLRHDRREAAAAKQAAADRAKLVTLLEMELANENETQARQIYEKILN